MTAEDYGFRTPTDQDLIRNGADVITYNAEQAAYWIDRLRWPRHSLNDTSDINALIGLHVQGVYGVHTSALAARLGLPGSGAGALTVIWLNNTGATGLTLQVWENAAGRRYSRTYTSTWGPWQNYDIPRGTLPSGTNIDTYRTPAQVGDWDISTSRIVSTTTGLPTASVGVLSVLATAQGSAFQRYTTSPTGEWTRHVVSTSTGAWSPWRRVLTTEDLDSMGVDEAAVLAILARDDVQEQFRGEPGPEGSQGARGPEGPQGIPAPDAVPASEAVAAYIESADSPVDVALKERYEPRIGQRGQTRRIYVRETGHATEGDGTAHNPYRQITTAINTLAQDGPVLRGSVVIDVGPGEYDGGIRMPLTRGVAQDDFIRIEGTAADGIPTTIIRPTTFSSTGILTEDGTAIWLRDLKFIGGFSAAVQLTRNVYGWFENIHADGRNEGVRGFSISAHARYYVRGGLIENFTYAGIDEYFAVSRSFATVDNSASQLLIRNCQIGLRAKEGCVGHLDYLRVEDCATGIELLQHSVANFKAVELRRNGTGLALINSSSHNEGGIVWGTGADANDREVYSSGASGELRAMMWTGEDMAAGSTNGHRPLFNIANDYIQKTITGSIAAETRITSFPQVLPRAFFRSVGKHFRIELVANITAATEQAPVSIIARVGSTLLGSVSITTPGVQRVEFDTVCTQDRTEHLTVSSVSGASNPFTTVSRSSTVLSGDPSAVASVTLYAKPSATGQEVTLYTAEIFG